MKTTVPKRKRLLSLAMALALVSGLLSTGLFTATAGAASVSGGDTGFGTSTAYTAAKPWFRAGDEMAVDSCTIVTTGSINITIVAFCGDGCTVELLDTLPDGLTYSGGVNGGELSGTVTENGSCTFRATSTADKTVYTDLTVNWTYVAITIYAAYYNGLAYVYDTGSRDVYIPTTGGKLDFFALGPDAEKVHDWKVAIDGTGMTCKPNGGYSSFTFCDRDDLSQKIKAPCQQYAFTPGSGLAVDDTVSITVTARDSEYNALGTQTFTVRISNGAVPDSLQMDADDYYGTQYTDYSFPGWSWDHTTGVLSLDNYTGSQVYSYEAPLTVSFTGTNTLGVCLHTDGEPLTLRGGDAGAVLRIDSTRSARSTLVTDELTVTGQGRVLASSSGTVLDSSQDPGSPVPVHVDRTVSELRLTGRFDGPVDLTVGEGTADYYLYNDTENADGRAGTFLFGTRTPAEADITVDGPDAVTEGESFTLAARLPDWVTGARRSGGEDLAFTVEYQWQKDGEDIDDRDGISGSRTAELCLSADGVGTAGDSAEYRCNITLTFDGMPAEIEGQSHTVTVGPPITIGGSVSGGTSSIAITSLEDSATLIVAQYTGGQMTAVKFRSIIGAGTYDLSGFTGGSGCTYQAMLLDADNRPLCAAAPLGTG